MFDGSHSEAEPSGLSRREAWQRVELLRERWAAEVLMDLAATEDASEVVSRGDLSAVDALSEVDYAAMDLDELAGSVLSLERTRRRVDAAMAAAMGCLDARHDARVRTGLNSARWRAHASYGSDTPARRDVAVGSIMRDFAVFAAEFRAARVSVDHLVVLSLVVNGRNRSALVAIEQRLVDIALTEPFRRYRDQIRQLARLLDPDGAEPDCDTRDHARMTFADTGELEIFVQLSGHNAVVAERLINDETDRQFRAAAAESAEAGTMLPSRAVLRARAITELLRRGAALPAGSSTKPRAEVVLAIREDRADGSAQVETSDGRVPDPATVAALACDAFFQPVVIDESDNPLYAGRSRRLFNQAQRNALVLRDRGCVFPGCDAPASWCDAHHVEFFSDGGRTDLDNAALLCRRHHGLVHSDEPWSLQRQALGGGAAQLVWENPYGELIPAQRAQSVSSASSGYEHQRRRPAA